MSTVSHRTEMLHQRFNALGLKVWSLRQPNTSENTNVPIETLCSGPLAASNQPEEVLPPTPTVTSRAHAEAPSGIESSPLVALDTVPSPVEPPIIRPTSLGVEFVQHWWYQKGLLLIDTRPADVSVMAQSEADQLLSALLRVCTGQLQPEVLLSIDWPLFEHRGIKHDWQEAQFYVQQRWQAFIQENAVEKVLLLGAESRTLLGFEQAELPASWIEAAGTATLMQSAAAKRDLWQALQVWLVKEG